MIMVRTEGRHAASYADLFPPLEPGSLLTGMAPANRQDTWNMGARLLEANPGKLNV